MKLIVTTAGFTRVIAVRDGTQDALDAAMALPAWTGLPLVVTSVEVSEGGPAPLTYQLVDRSAPVVPASSQDLYAYAGQRRYDLEIGGKITVGPYEILTDERTRSIVTAAYVRASEDPAYTVRWKVSAGVYVTLDSPTISAIASALTAFVQTLFNRNETADAAISAGTVTTRAAVDAILAGA